MSVRTTLHDKPPGITCQDWQPLQEGKKACLSVIKGDGVYLCSKGTNFLCVEWVKVNQHLVPATALVWGKQPTIASNDQSPPAGTPASPQADLFVLTPQLALEPPPKPVPQTSTTHAADLLMGKPMPYRPAKEIPGQDLEALEALGVELKLSAKNLPDTWIVAKKTGRIDRFELTFRELATIRLLVDAFPGCKVTALNLPPTLQGTTST
jgi:hypothetical protein